MLPDVLLYYCLMILSVQLARWMDAGAEPALILGSADPGNFLNI
jgi:hypothetical protein